METQLRDHLRPDAGTATAGGGQSLFHRAHHCRLCNQVPLVGFGGFQSFLTVNYTVMTTLTATSFTQK